MALGHAEGGEQNAPLGRAVIGGLLFGTFASLFVVPLAFDFIARRVRHAPLEQAMEPPVSAPAVDLHPAVSARSH
jgi:hypothetical protein